MQPYQQAAQEIKRQGEIPLKAAKNVASGVGAAASAYYGGGAINRVLPFLSQYIPENIAKKGLEKIDPRYGTFIDKALSAGQTFDEVKQFIGDKIQESQPEEPAKDDRNPIEKHSPNLFQYLKDLISGGETPGQAAQKAKKYLKDSKMQNIMKKIEEEYKTDWTSLVESIFGNTGAQPSAMSMQDAGNAQMMRGQPQQMENGPGNQRLLSAIQQLRQTRGG